MNVEPELAQLISILSANTIMTMNTIMIVESSIRQINALTFVGL